MPVAQRWFLAAGGAALLLAMLAVALSLAPRPSVTPDDSPHSKGAQRPVEQPGEKLEKSPPIASSDIALEQTTLTGEPLPLGGLSEAGARTVLRYYGVAKDAAVEFEVKPAMAQFDGAAARSHSLDAGGVARYRHELDQGAYHWRARVRRDGADGAWQEFDASAPTHFIITRPPPRPAAKQPDAADDGPGSASSMSSEGGQGDSRPNPSDMDRLASLWSMLTPVAIVLALLALAAGAFGAWRRRASRRQ